VRFVINPRAEDDSWQVMGKSSHALLSSKEGVNEGSPVLCTSDDSLAQLLRYLEGSEWLRSDFPSKVG